MASCNLLTTTTFSAPFCCCPPPTSLKVMCGEKFDLGRVSHKAVAVTAANLPARCSSNLNRGLFSVSRSCHCFLTATCKRFDEIVYCSLDVAICNNVASAYPELLQLTWISHHPLAFCPENGRTECIATPVFEALVCACRLPMCCEHIMKFDTMIPWSEPLEATFIPKTLYQENP